MLKRLLILVVGVLLVGSIGYAVEEGIFYYHNDQLGSPRVVTDGIGSVVWSSDYEDFGKAVNENGDNNYKFTGKELDESTGLYYYGARYYDSSLGRFITADTAGGAITDSQSLNKYSYVKNNPLKYADPSGGETKNALIILANPNADWNKAFKDFGYNLQKLENAGYNTVIDTVSTREEYFRAFEKATETLGGKLDFYLGGAHGEPRSIILSLGKERRFNRILNIFYSKDMEQLTSEDLKSHDLSGYFNEGARGIQYSCSAADTTCSDNFAQSLANVAGIPIEGLLKPFGGYISDLHLVAGEWVTKKGLSSSGEGILPLGPLQVSIKKAGGEFIGPQGEHITVDPNEIYHKEYKNYVYEVQPQK